MKAEHEALIEAMAEALWNAGGRSRPWSALTDADRAVIRRRIIAALQAAKDREYRLASLPDERLLDGMAEWPSPSRLEGFNDCLKLIDTVDLGELDG